MSHESILPLFHEAMQILEMSPFHVSFSKSLFILKITRLLVDKTGAGIFHSNARAFYTGDRTKSRSSSRSRQFVGQEGVRVEVMFSFNFLFFISQSQFKTLSTQIQHVTNWLGKHGILRRLFWWSSS